MQIYSDEPPKRNMRPYSELLEKGSSELITKLKFLVSKGYCLSNKNADFLTGEAYNMVYWENNDMDRRGYSFIEDGIIYTLYYDLNRPDDPNYFTTAFLIIDDIIYWFFKVNFFFEYDIEKKWVEEDGSEIILKAWF
jgi:hypothetical protein